MIWTYPAKMILVREAATFEDVPTDNEPIPDPPSYRDEWRRRW